MKHNSFKVLSHARVPAPRLPQFATLLGTALLRITLALAVSCSDKKQETANSTTASPQQTPTVGASEPVDPSLLERVKTERWTGDLDEMVKRRYLRVLVVYNKTYYFVDGAQAHGLTYEAVKGFQKMLNDKLKTGETPVQVVFVPVRRDELLTGLAEGRGDIAASYIAITPERQKIVAFSDAFRTGGKEIVVTGPAAPALASVEDLSGKEVYIRKSSQYWESLSRLNAQLKQAGKPEVILKPADENLEDEDILEMINAGLIKTTVTDDLIAQFWSQVYDGIKLHPELVVATGDQIAWAVNPKSQKLLALINEYVIDHKLGTSFGNTILQRYLKDTKWVKNNTATADLKRFQANIEFFKKYGDMYGFEWRMVAAEGYQESGLDQSRKNPSGAVGVMQIKPSTAAGNPINIPNVENSAEDNIHAGVKYLRFITDQYFKDEPKDQMNKTLFAFASYNAGPARIAKLRQQAKEEGLDPNIWFNHVELIAAREIGRETVTYVSNIYKYYVSYTLITEREASKKGR